MRGGARLFAAVGGIALIALLGLSAERPSGSANAADLKVAGNSVLGSLLVQVTDLPKGTDGKVTVAGPNGYHERLEKTSTLKNLAPGSYVVAASMVHDEGVTFIPTVTGSPATVTAGATATVTASYGSAVADIAKVVSPSAVSGVTGDPGGPQTLTLGGSGLPPLAPGDIIGVGVGPTTPDGFLGKVLSVTDNGGLVTVQTGPASLLDAVPSGEINLDTTLDTTSVQDVAALQGASTRLAPRRSRFNAIARAAASSLSCGAGGSITLGRSISFNPRVTFKVTWGGGMKVNFSVSGTETAQLSASAETGVNCSIGKTALLASPIRLKPYTFFVGWFPVVVTPTVQYYITASGKLSAHIDTSVTQQLTASAGINYANGSFSPTSSLSNQFTYSSPTPYGTGSLKATIGPDLTLLLYGAAGPAVNLYAGADLEANTSATPWWTLTGSLYAGAGLTVPVLKLNYAKPNLITFSRILAQSNPGSARPDQGDIPAVALIRHSVTSLPSPASGSANYLAQTFTAGLTGQLTDVQIALSTCNSPSPCTSGGPRTGDATLVITGVDAAGLPNLGAILATSSVPNSSIPFNVNDVDNPTPIDFRFSSPARVQAGTRYALVTYRSGSNPDNTQTLIYDTEADIYSGGGWYVGNLANTWGLLLLGPGSTSVDTYFQTYVVTG